MASKDDLNYVAYHIIEVLEEQGLDNFYIDEKNRSPLRIRQK
ncbi:hypothetical protein NRA44_16010 [Acinetobacter baumannii]|nr:hypothetical protein [Acinetobacter baumannii]